MPVILSRQTKGQQAWWLLKWSYVCTALLHWWLCSSSKWESWTVGLQLVGHLYQLGGPRPYQAQPQIRHWL